MLAGHAYLLGGRAVPIKAQQWYDVPLSLLATGVWLFFGISGYVISRPFVERVLDGGPLPALGPYLVRRTLRIFPLYWIALTLVIVIAGDRGTAGWQLPVHYLLLNNLVPGRQEALFSVAWTLTLEMLFYFLVPIAATLVRRVRRVPTPEHLAAWVVASWAASVGFTVLADLQGDGTRGLWMRGSILAMWQMFCPGILLAIAPHLRSARGKGVLGVALAPAGRLAMIILLIGGAVLAACAPLRFGIVAYQLMVDATRPLFAVGYGILLALAIRSRAWGGLDNGKRSGPWLLELGLISYGIYLLHAVIVAFLVAHPALIPWRDRSPWAFAGHVALLAVLTVPLALASWRWLERPIVTVSRRYGSAPRSRSG